MRYGPLFLAVTARISFLRPVRGLNLAMADVWRLADALAAFYTSGMRGLSRPTPIAGCGVSGAHPRFSWWMTSMLHRNDSNTAFDERRQLAELDYP
jgi:p-hydroxybenzoate 3-monooxygenase